VNTVETYQPDFSAIATKMVSMGAHVVPVPYGTKACTLPDWQNKATRDLTQIERWAKENQHYNVAIVGKPEVGALWGFDDDSGILAEYESQHGPIKTYRTRSVSGGTHLLFKHNEKSITMGNLSGKDENGGETWSARVSNRYVISAGSVAHPNNDPSQPLTAYTAVDTSSPVEAPDTFISFLQSKARGTESKTGDNKPETIVHEGGRNSMLTSALGTARQAFGYDKEQLLTLGLELNQKRCVPPLSDEEVKTIANSVGRYDVKPPAPDVVMGGKNLSQQTPEKKQIVYPDIPVIPHPVFPRWVMTGTSLYEGLVKPVCAVNSRYPEFMFMPAVALVLNYLGGKVRIEYKNLIPSLYLVMVGKKGSVIKSSSVKDAIEYLNHVGIVDDAGPQTRNAEGKSLVFTAGSPEGLGLEMSRTNCKNVVLFYDELSHLVNKVGIEKSSLGQALLLMYESSKFANSVKTRKDQYNFAAGSYCASLIACTTDKDFTEQWSQLAVGKRGLDERFMFIYQPEHLSPLTPQISVDTKLAAATTRKLIDKAVNQGVYRFDDMTPLEKKIAKLGNRTEIRAEKIALYFAIDLGRDSIDEDCVDRALAIVEYEKAVKKYLGGSDESVDRLAAAQTKYCRLLQRAPNGMMTDREIKQQMGYRRYSTELWDRIEGGLIRSGHIIKIGSGVPGDPLMVRLLEPVIEEE
jgi:hypothetical protein